MAETAALLGTAAVVGPTVMMADHLMEGKRNRDRAKKEQAYIDSLPLDLKSVAAPRLGVPEGSSNRPYSSLLSARVASHGALQAQTVYISKATLDEIVQGYDREFVGAYGFSRYDGAGPGNGLPTDISEYRRRGTRSIKECTYVGPNSNIRLIISKTGSGHHQVDVFHFIDSKYKYKRL